MTKTDSTPRPATEQEQATSWLDQYPCPSWCDRLHGGEHFPEDRKHWGVMHEVGMTLEKMVKMSGDEWAVDVMRVYLRQGWREVCATIGLDRGDEAGVTLTPAEARELGEAPNPARRRGRTGRPLIRHTPNAAIGTTTPRPRCLCRGRGVCVAGAGVVSPRTS